MQIVSTEETICMKCQIVSWEEKYFKMLSAKIFIQSAKSWIEFHDLSCLTEAPSCNAQHWFYLIVILNRTDFRWFSKLDLDVNLQNILYCKAILKWAQQKLNQMIW